MHIPIRAEQLPIAIIGGRDGSLVSGIAYAAFVDLNTNAAGPALTGLPTAAGSYVGVSINNLRQAFVGGANGLDAYAAFVNAQMNAVNAPVSNLIANGFLQAGTINDFNQVLVGGLLNGGGMYAAFVDIQTNAAGPAVAGIPTNTNPFTSLWGATINNAQQALIVGSDTSAPYAARVDPKTNAVSALIANIPGGGDALYSCSFNQSGLGLIGGRDTDNGTAYTAFIAPNTNTASLNILNSSMGIFRIYGSVLNDFGTGLIGGQTDSGMAYAAFVDPKTHVVYPISGLPMGAGSYINATAINNFDQGLIGGFDGVGAYAAFVDPITKTVSSLITNLPATMGSAIYSVALVMTPRLPTNNLNGNNLIFANYINANAPQTAFYFVPAWVGGNLSDALENAAPMRNAISLFTADNNLLYLSNSLSIHLRNHRHFREHKRRKPIAMAASFDRAHQEANGYLPSSQQEISAYIEHFSVFLETSEEQLSQKQLIPNEVNQTEESSSIEDSVCSKSSQKPSGTEMIEDLSYSLWSQAIGAFASQKEQKQTPGFDPSVGGIMVAFDAKTNAKSIAGGGVAYTFTHISEKKDAGYSHINQEYVFGYASWMNEHFYFDGVLWTGFFQIHQVRDINLSGFQFRSVSSPQGWQLSPHVEFGYDHTWTLFQDRSLDLILDPFVMLDWVNAWQQAYQERGTSPFNAGQTAHYSSLLRSEIGLRFYQTCFYKRWICTFEEKGSYVNKTPFGVGKVNAFLVGSPGAFTVETLTASQNLGVVEVALIAEPLDQIYPYGSISYQGEFGPSYQSHQLSAEVSWDF